MMEFDLKIHRSRRSWFLIGILVLLLLPTFACLSAAELVEEQSFSNLMVDGDNLWFGAGYKLYRIDLNQQTATLVYDTDDVLISFVQIDDKNLFFGGSGGRKNLVWLLDLDSENILWKQEIDNRFTGVFVTPPLVSEELFMIGARHEFYALDKTNGKIMWKIENNWFGTGQLLTPTLVNEQLIYGAYVIGENGPQSDHTIAVADLSSGKTIRTISMPGRLGAIPAFHGNCLFVKDHEDAKRDGLRLNCIDLLSGGIVWSVGGRGYPELSRLGFYNGWVFDIFADQLFAIDEKSGALQWQSQGLDETIKNPQIVGELEWVALEAPDSKKVFFLDLTTGKLREEALVNVLSSPVFFGNEAIYGTINAIVRVDIVTGRIIWTIPADSLYFTRQYDD